MFRTIQYIVPIEICSPADGYPFAEKMDRRVTNPQLHGCCSLRDATGDICLQQLPTKRRSYTPGRTGFFLSRGAATRAGLLNYRCLRFTDVRPTGSPTRPQQRSNRNQLHRRTCLLADDSSGKLKVCSQTHRDPRRNTEVAPYHPRTSSPSSGNF